MQMRLQDYVANLTESATATLFRNAYAIPPEKLTWTQCEQTRSALDQLQECSQTALVFSKILRGESVEMSPRNFIKAKRERESWTTIEKCEKHAVTHTLELMESIRNFPESRLEERTIAPWGSEVTFGEILIAQYWNVVWHTGQIAYMQRIWGDKAMH